ncbi:MAG: hypothetical protein V6Z89_23430 [Desulfobacter sp.]
MVLAFPLTLLEGYYPISRFAADFKPYSVQDINPVSGIALLSSKYMPPGCMPCFRAARMSAIPAGLGIFQFSDKFSRSKSTEQLLDQKIIVFR